MKNLRSLPIFRGGRWAYLQLGLAFFLLGCLWVGLKKLVAPDWAWGISAKQGFVACLIFGVVTLVIASPAFFRRCVGEATAESLGAIRVLVCGLMLTFALAADIPSTAFLPEEMRWSTGVIQYLYAIPGFETFLDSNSALMVFKLITVLLLVLATVGWQTRLVLPLGTLGYLVLMGIIFHYSWFSHSGLVPFYLGVVLSFTPCNDSFSVDRLGKIYRGQAVPAVDRPFSVYGWSRYACWVVIALVYIAAGLSKFRNSGLFWWNATNMRRILYTDSLNPMFSDWGLSLHLTQAPDFLFALLGLFGVLGEVAYGVVLVSTLGRRILPAMMASMHAGIFFLQNVPFFDLILLQLVFYDFTAVRRAVARWVVARRGTVQVLYDGFCPFCRRTVGLLASFDLLERLEFIDFRQLDLATFNRDRNLDLVPENLAKEMYVLDRNGKAYAGFYGYRIIALALPMFWLLVPLLFMPGVPALGVPIYDYVARNRFKLIQCDTSCEIGPVEAEDPSDLIPLAQRGAQGFRYPLLAIGLTMLLTFCWVNRIEFYPLTAVQMYSFTPKDPESVEYYKVLLRRQSGETSRAHLEDVIGAMEDGRYRRPIIMCFVPKNVHICKKFLAASGAAYNRKAQAGEKVTALEVQQWRWNFVADPADPEHGAIADRFILNLETNAVETDSGKAQSGL